MAHRLWSSHSHCYELMQVRNQPYISSLIRQSVTAREKNVFMAFALWCVLDCYAIVSLSFLCLLRNIAHIWGFRIYSCMPGYFCSHPSHCSLLDWLPPSYSARLSANWLCRRFGGETKSLVVWGTGEHIMIMAHIAPKSIGGSSCVGLGHFASSEVVTERL